MDTSKLDPLMQQILEPVRMHHAGMQAAFAADRQYIQAAEARIKELETALREANTYTAQLERRLEVTQNERNRLHEFCDSFAEWKQVLTGNTEPTLIDEDVVIAALKVLRDRHIDELEKIIEPLHRKWVAQFCQEYDDE